MDTENAISSEVHFNKHSISPLQLVIWNHEFQIHFRISQNTVHNFHYFILLSKMAPFAKHESFYIDFNNLIMLYNYTTLIQKTII